MNAPESFSHCVSQMPVNGPRRRDAYYPHKMATLPSYPRGRHTIAYHEAGHVLFAWLLSLPVKSAQLSESREGDKEIKIKGRVELSESLLDSSSTGPYSKQQIDQLDQRTRETLSVMIAAFSLAGMMAETILHGIEVDGWLKLDCTDWQSAKATLSRVFGHDFALYFAQCVARFILVERWELVKAIAFELDTKGQLTTDDLARLCAGHSQDHDWVSVIEKW